MQMFHLSNEPKVSVIVTTYNGAAYIAETIASIRAQTYTHWELIILDDGSVDDTPLIIKNIVDERISFYQLGRIAINGKVKNIGLQKATGDLIAFLDHDDLWASSKLEKQVIALRKSPNAGFCLSNGYNFRGTITSPVSYLFKPIEGEKVGNVFLSFFRSELSAWIQTLLVHRVCIEESGTFIEDGLFGDPDFVLNLAAHFNGVILYEPLFYRRQHDNNTSSNNWARYHQRGIDIIRAFHASHRLPKDLARDALFRSHINFGEKYLARNQKGSALKQFLLAWKNKVKSPIPLKKIGKTVLYSYSCITCCAVFSILANNTG